MSVRLRLGVPALALAAGLVLACGSSGKPASCRVDSDCPSGSVCNAGACQAPLTLAITSPTVPGTTVFVNAAVTVKVTVSGGQPTAVELLLDGSHLTSLAPPDYQYSWDTRAVAEGAHQLKATVTLGGAVFNSPAVDVVVKRTPPAVPTLVVSSPTNAQPVPITGTADSGSTVTLLEGGTAAGSGVVATAANTWSTALPLAEGTHTLTATATDAAGNVSAASSPLTVIVDRTPPAAPVIDPVPSPTSLASVLVGGSAEAGSTLVVASNGATAGQVAPVPASGAWSLALALPAGTDTLTAVATDAAGNASSPSAAVVVVVDRELPAAPTLTAASPTNAQPVPVSGSAPGNAIVKVYEGATTGTALATVVASAAGTWTAGLTLAEGSHVLTATATNAAGTTSGPSAPLTVVVDRTAPTVTARAPAPGKLDVALGTQKIQATFSDPIAAATVSSATMKLTDSTTLNEISSTTTASADRKQWTINPVTPLAVTGADAIGLTVTLTAGLQDDAGNALQLPAGAWTFGAPAFLPVGALGAPSVTPGGLAWDSQKRLWLAGIETGAPQLAAVRRWDGTQWTRMPTLNLDPTHNAWEISLAVTPAGDPVVAWVEDDATATRQLHVRKLTGSAWTALGVSGSLNQNTAAFAGGPSIAIDKGSGQPVAAWYEAAGGSTPVVVKRFDGGASWNLLGGAAITSAGAVGLPISLTMNGSSPVVAWQDSGTTATPFGYSVRVWSSAGGTGPWMPIGSSPNPTNDSFFPSIAMDGSNPVVAFLEQAACPTCPGLIQVMRYDGTAWSRVGVNYLNRNPSQQGLWPRIAVKGPGAYVVAWTEHPNPGDVLHVSAWNGAQWAQLEHQMLNQGGTATMPVLALDGSTVPTVAWCELSAAATQPLYVYRYNQ